MPDTTTPATDFSPPTVRQTDFSDPVIAAFAALERELRAAALDAPLDSEREGAFLKHVRTVAARWTAGERSPARTASAKEAA